MPGPFALIGGEEFSDGFEDVHAALMETAARGIDEQTALLGNGNTSWQVIGRGRAALIDDHYNLQTFVPGDRLHFPAQADEPVRAAKSSAREH